MAKLYVLAAVLGALFTGWVGYQLCDAKWQKREAETAKAYVANQNAAVEATRGQLEAQNRETLRRERESAILKQRQMGEAHAYELAIATRARAECAMDDESFRLLLESIDRANRTIVGNPN